MNLRVHRLAVEEIDHEVDYYESISPGLGTELEDESDAALEIIARVPEVGAPWRRRLDRRIFVLSRFPFTLPYQILDGEIVVLAFAHMSKRPGYWARRR